ncbi:MAG: hypothetical protein NTX03_09220 [Bacteroidetes bacterium]|nr:hypothetical protein [Bacteroidota bacterium]
MKKIILILLVPLLGLINSCKKDSTTTTPVTQVTGLSYDSTLSNTVGFASVPSSGGKLPSSFDFSADMPPIGNQGNQGSCVGWAIGYALKSYQEMKENKYSKYDNSNLMSAAYIYNQAKISSDCNSGMYLPRALDLLVNEGVCSLNDFGYDQTDCSKQPSSNNKKSAKVNRVKNFGAVKKNMSDIKTYISTGIPVVFGATIDQDFNDAKTIGSGDFIWKSNTSKKLGGHALIIVGYDDNLNAVKVQNSWGTIWGNKGYACIDYSWLLSQAYEFYVTEDGNFSEAGFSVSGNSPQDVKVNTTQTFNVTITNTSTQQLSVTDLTINTNNTDVYYFTNTSQTKSFTISAGGKTDISLSFSPKTEQTYTCTLIVSTNSTAGDKSLELSGNGVNTITTGDSFVDARDNKIYKIAKIGTQIWMAENLEYKSGDVSIFKGIYYYDFADAKKVAPKGWHLPSDAEWKKLELYLGMSQSDADYEGYWRGNDQGKKMQVGGSSGLNLNLTGFTRIGNTYTEMDGYNGYFWSSTVKDYNTTSGFANVYSRTVQLSNPQVERGYADTYQYKLAIRCVKD